MKDSGTGKIGVRLVHVTTVPQSLSFFHGQVGYLRERGFDVSVVSSPGERLGQFSCAENVDAYSVVMARRIDPVRDLVSLCRLWRIFRDIKPEIVHSHTPKAGLLGTLAARLSGVPVVMLSVFGLPQMTKSGPVRHILDLTTKLATRLADRVWCDSFSMRDYLAREGLCDPNKIVVIGSGSVKGVDAVNVFSPELHNPHAREKIRASLGIHPAAQVLGFVGRITKDKGMRELAEAWRSIRAARPDAHLILVGPFEPDDAIPEEDERLFRDDERVHAVGLQRNVPEYLAAMDVFVMPSYREGFGMVNIEAAAMELPVVSTSIPGCVDSVQDGVTGTLVPPRDAAALQAAIECYLDDAELRSAHGRAGRQRVLEEFKPELIWSGLHNEYLGLIARSGKPRRPAAREALRSRL